MIDKLLKDTINTVHDVLLNIESTSTNYFDYWMWIAIIEFSLIIYIVFFRKKTESIRDKLKRESKDVDIDFGNIINSSFHVKPLYDELKIKCHPDRFPNDKEKNKIALDLFQEVSRNKTNYKKLIELKEFAKQNLNIN